MALRIQGRDCGPFQWEMCKKERRPLEIKEFFFSPARTLTGEITLARGLKPNETKVACKVLMKLSPVKRNSTWGAVIA